MTKTKNVRKKDAMEFIGKCECKAIDTLENKYYKLIKEEEDKLIKDKGYMEKINKIQNLLNEIFKLDNELGQQMSEDKDIGYCLGSYYSLSNRLNTYYGQEGNRYYKSVKEACNFMHSKINKLHEEREDSISGTKKEYRKIEEILFDLPTGKEAGQYLEELGFDISSIKPEEKITSLATKIDKSKVFVCNDNK